MGLSLNAMSCSRCAGLAALFWSVRVLFRSVRVLFWSVRVLFWSVRVLFYSVRVLFWGVFPFSLRLNLLAIFLPSGAPSSLAAPGRAMRSGVLGLGPAETSDTLGNKSKGTSLALF